MPIYEYTCRGCGHKFEKLVLRGQTPECPSCQGSDLEQLFSTPAVSTERTRQRSLSDGHRRAQKVRTEKEHAQREYERNYIKDHS